MLYHNNCDNSCKFYLDDRSTGCADCENENMTEDEIDEYFCEGKSDCPYKTKE
jgi:hypothetical protein